MKKLRAILLSLALAAAAGGCFKQRYVVDASAGVTEARVDETRWVFLWGLTPTVEANAPGACKLPQQVESQVPAWGALVGVVTLGIAVPVRVVVRCAPDF